MSLHFIKSLLFPDPPTPQPALGKRKHSRDTERRASSTRRTSSVSRGSLQSPQAYEQSDFYAESPHESQHIHRRGSSFDARYANAGPSTRLEQSQPTSDGRPDRPFRRSFSGKAGRTISPEANRRVAAPSPRGENAPAPKSQWDLTPNRRARDLLAKNQGDATNAARAIKIDLARNNAAEPEYTFRDVEIRDAQWQVLDLLERFAREHFSFDLADDEFLTNQFKTLAPETVKIIGNVASSGPRGHEGWRQLFKDEQKRRALVCAIIGNVLSEQVYQHVFFGGTEKDMKEIGRIQEKLKNSDSFDRNKAFADRISKSLNYDRTSPASTIPLPHNFTSHTQTVISALYTHLEPLLRLNPKSRSTLLIKPSPLTRSLTAIVTKAGLLSLLMRLDPHTVYYLVPLFKEDSYTPQAMECFNRTQVEALHPARRVSWPEDYTEQDIKHAKGDALLTQITIMQGITAYRRGGWETLDSTVEKPIFEKGAKGKGIRSRVLTHGWVYCRWGRARKFVKGVEKVSLGLHGREWQGGFVEFGDAAQGEAEVGDGEKWKGKARKV